MTIAMVNEDVFGQYTLVGWEIRIGLFTVRATRGSEESTAYGVVFHAEDGKFTTLTGRGAFAAIREIRPAIIELDRLTGGNWVAACDDPKRERAYRRWLPANRIFHG